MILGYEKKPIIQDWRLAGSVYHRKSINVEISCMNNCNWMGDIGEQALQKFMDV